MGARSNRMVEFVKSRYYCATLYWQHRDYSRDSISQIRVLAPSRRLKRSNSQFI